MNRIHAILTACVLATGFSHQHLYAQLIGGTLPGEPTPRTVEKANLSGETYAGDVDLFTGAYNASYSLGSVGTPGGLAFELKLNYGSSHTVGQHVPLVNGIPYGEGWSLNIPTVSVSHSAYSHKTAENYNTYMHSSTLPSDTVRMEYGTSHGDLYWQSPYVNIPGVFSGRMVLKRVESNSLIPVYVPYQFEEYGELHLLGSRWEFHLADGTVYEFGLAKSAFRNASNVRDLHYDPANGPSATTEPYSNVVQEMLRNFHLPKREMLQWYCTRIYNKRLPNFQNIRFKYDLFGPYNYFNEFSEHYDYGFSLALTNQLLAFTTWRVKKDKDGNVVYDQAGNPVLEEAYNPTYPLPQLETYRNIILSEVFAGDYYAKTQRIRLKHRTKYFANHFGMQYKGQQGVHALDSLYVYSSIWYQGRDGHDATHTFTPGVDPNFYDADLREYKPISTQTQALSAFADWKRFLHPMHDTLQHFSNVVVPASVKNPYVGTSGGAGPYYFVEENVDANTGQGLPFNHGFLESPGITQLIPGEQYELRTHVGGVNPDRNLFLFDINVKAEYSAAQPFGANIGHVRTYRQQDVEEAFRNRPVFSTFGNGVKWATYSISGSQAGIQQHRVTSNYFTMPTLSGSPTVKVQIGPANSDHHFSEVNGTDYGLQSNYFGTDDDRAKDAYAANVYNTPGAFTDYKPSENTPRNFGIGLPWYQLRQVYEQVSQTPNELYDFWWNFKPGHSQYNYGRTWENEPTLAKNVYLNAVELLRHSQSPYMLDSVIVEVLNGESNGITDPGWTTTRALKLEHDNVRHAYVPVYLQNEKSTYATDLICVDPTSTLMYANVEVAPGVFEEQLVEDTVGFGSTTIERNYIVLTEIIDLPIRPTQNRDSISVSEVAAAPTTHFDYARKNIYDTTYTVAEQVRIAELGAWSGGVVLNRITNPLGGIRAIDYHDYADRETHYSISNWGSGGGTFGSDGSNRTVQVTLPVRSVRTWAGGSDWQQTDYRYNRSSFRIANNYNTSLSANSGNWAGDPSFSTQAGYGVVTMLHPELNGLRPYETFEFITDPSEGTVVFGTCSGGFTPVDTVQKLRQDTALLFGKLHRHRVYSGTDILLEETTHDYAYQQAYANAVVRPFNSLPTGFRTDYADYVQSNLPANLQTQYQDLPIRIGDWAKYEQPLFMESVNRSGPGFRGTDASWFIMRTRTEKRSFATDQCNENYQTATPAPPGFSNPILIGGDDTLLIQEMRNGDYTGGDEPLLQEALLQDLPTTDSVLATLIDHTVGYTNALIRDVLVAQPDLSDARLLQVIHRDVPLTDATVRDILLSAPYRLSDTVLTALDDALPDFEHRTQVINAQDGLSVRDSTITLPANLNQYYVNPVSWSQTRIDDDIQWLSDNEGDDNLLQDYQDTAFPLPDPVLRHVLTLEQIEDTRLMAYLQGQPDLSDSVLQDAALSTLLSHTQLTQLYREVPHVISQEVMSYMLSQSESMASNTVEQLCTDHPYLPEQTVMYLVNESPVSLGSIETILTYTRYLTDNALLAIVNRTAPLSSTKLATVFDNQAVYPVEPVLDALSLRLDDYAETGLISIFTHPSVTLSPVVSIRISNSPFISPNGKVLVEQVFNNQVSLDCTAPSLTGGTLSIGSVTEREYCRAQPNGISAGPAYPNLMGSTSAVQLHFEPSWQVFRERNYSPEFPDAFTETEYYYLYDLHNRYNPDAHVTIDLYGSAQGSINPETGDTLWSYYLTVGDASELAHEKTGQSFPDPENLVGARVSRQKDIRTLAYQKRITRQNNRDTVPEIFSEYYDYHSDWPPPPDHRREADTITGPPCPTGGGGTPHPDPLIAAGCEYHKKDVETIPVGWLVWVQYPNGPIIDTYYRCPCEAMDTASISDTLYPIQSEPMSLLQMFEETGGCIAELTSDNWSQYEGSQVLLAEFAFRDVLMPGAQWLQLDTLDRHQYRFYRDSTGSSSSVPLLEFVERTGPQKNTSRYAFPFPSLRQWEIIEINSFGQPQLVRNEHDLYTRYHYDTVTMRSYRDTACWLNSYSAVYYPNIGVPTRIDRGVTHRVSTGVGQWTVVTAGQPDSLTTFFNWNADYSLNRQTEPNGEELSFGYDDLGRMTWSARNGIPVETHAYRQWNNDTTLSFDQRAAQNYVRSCVRNCDNSILSECAVAYVDPLGRAHHEASYTGPDTADYPVALAAVHSGPTVYDSWNRPVRQYKPFELDSAGVPLPVVPRPHAVDTVAWPCWHTGTAYEDDPRSRPLREAKYGLALGGLHNVRYRYRMLNAECLQCELDLTDREVWLLMHTDVQKDQYVFTVVTTTDEDGKESTTYRNALGQTIGTLGGNSDARTLFTYDHGGRNNRVIHPNKLETTYDYNLHGLLWRKTTPDEGTWRYVYNRSGKLRAEYHAESMRIPGTGGADSAAWYRAYTYDAFMRPHRQAKVYFSSDTSEASALFKLLATEPFAWKPQEPNGNYTYSGDTRHRFVFSHALAYDFLGSTVYWEWIGVPPAGDWEIVQPYREADGSYNSVYGDDELAGNGLSSPEKQWFYSFAPQLYSNRLHPNAKETVQDDATYLRGRTAAIFTWGDDLWGGTSTPIQQRYFAYNHDGEVKWEVQQVNPNGITVSGPGIATCIRYPAYDTRGNVLAMNVDVHCDSVLDIQYAYRYDLRGRAQQAYVNFDNVRTNGNLLAEYVYSDGYGLHEQTTYFNACDTYVNGASGAYPLDSLQYSYDERDRLTELNSRFVDQWLEYDLDTLMGGSFGLHADTAFNGNINAMRVQYDLGTFGSIPYFDQPTTYGYQYDNLNRLTTANGHVPDLMLGATTNDYQIGDVTVSYDQAGNIEQLNRTLHWNTGATALSEQRWNYLYQAGTNRLITASGIGSTADRHYTYDARGNLQTDDSRVLNSTTYGRANLPFGMEVGTDAMSYLYDDADLRIFKGLETNGNGSPLAVTETADYYLRTGAGQEIGVLDMIEGTWTWYVFGQGQRFAKIEPKPDQQPPYSAHAFVNDSSIAPGGEDIMGYFDLRDRLTLLHEGGASYPNKLIAALNEETGEQEFYFESEWPAVEANDGRYKNWKNGELELEGTERMLTITRDTVGSHKVWLPLHEIHLPYVPSTGDPAPIDSTSLPTEDIIDDTFWQTHANTALDSVIYYVHDYLGNTRVTYAASLKDCGQTGLDSTITLASIDTTLTVISVDTLDTVDYRFDPPLYDTTFVYHYDTSYVYLYDTTLTALGAAETFDLHYAGDYFPYGKILKEYQANKQERYLTTHHERDDRLGFDYRGARYYDSDVARFLSLDPASVEYPTFSDYLYVAGNPIAFIDPDGMRVRYAGKGSRKSVRQARKRSESFNTAFKALRSDKEDTFHFIKRSTTSPEVVSGAENTFDPQNVIAQDGSYISNPNIGNSVNGMSEGRGDEVYLSFREPASETVSMAGSDLPLVKTRKLQSKSTKNFYTAGTISISGSSNIDTGNGPDRITITAPGNLVIYDQNITPVGAGMQFNPEPIKFDLGNTDYQRAKLRIVIKNDNAKKGNPDGFYVNVKIEGQ